MRAEFIATLVEGEAVLRFPIDDRLRLMLRAIPGRRWDPEARVWRLPLDPDRAHALSALFATVPYPLEVFECREIIEQVGVTTHDQLAVIVVATRPTRQAVGHDSLGQLIELGASSLTPISSIEEPW